MALLSYEDPHMFVLVVVLTTDKQSEISSQLFVYCWTRVSGCEFCEDRAFSKLVSHFSGFRMLVSVGSFRFIQRQRIDLFFALIYIWPLLL